MSFDYTLRPGDTHLWLISLAALGAQAEILQAILDPQECSAASRMHFRRDRVERIVSRALLRLLAGAYCAEAPESLRVSTTSSGKPRLVPRPGEPALEFNVSHSCGLALYAFSRAEVGVDIELVDPAIEFTPIARQVFSPAELSALQRASPQRARELFYRFWTAKEAYVKATGTGLSEELVEIDFSRLEHAPGITPPHAGRDSCSIWPIDAAAGYRAALAICGAPATASLRMLRVDPGRLALGAAWPAVFADRTALGNALGSAIAGSALLDLRR